MDSVTKSRKKRSKSRSKAKKINFDEEATVVSGVTTDDSSSAPSGSPQAGTKKHRKSKKGKGHKQREKKTNSSKERKAMTKKLVSRLYGAPASGSDKASDVDDDDEMSEEESRKRLQLMKQRARQASVGGSRRRGLAEIRPTILSMSIAKDWESLEVQLSKMTNKGDPELNEINEASE